MASETARIRYARKHEEVELRKAFNMIDFKCDNLIDAEELEQLFIMMDHRPEKIKVKKLNSRVTSKTYKAPPPPAKKGR